MLSVDQSGALVILHIVHRTPAGKHFYACQPQYMLCPGPDFLELLPIPNAGLFEMLWTAKAGLSGQDYYPCWPTVGAGQRVRTWGYLVAHCHWCAHMSSTVYLLFQPSSFSANSVAAHTATLSPARRSIIYARQQSLPNLRTACHDLAAGAKTRPRGKGLIFLHPSPTSSTRAAMLDSSTTAQ